MRLSRVRHKYVWFVCHEGAFGAPAGSFLGIFNVHREHLRRTERRHRALLKSWFPELSWTCWQSHVGGWKRYGPCKILTADSKDWTGGGFGKSSGAREKVLWKEKCFPAEAWAGATGKFALFCVVLGRWRAGVEEKDECRRQGNDEQGWYGGCDKERSELRQFEWSWHCFRLWIKISVRWGGARGCSVSTELVKPDPAAFLLLAQIPSSLVERGTLSSAGHLSCQLILCSLCDKPSRWLQVAHTELCSSELCSTRLAACLECRAGKTKQRKNWSPVSYVVCFLQVLCWLINTVTPCQTSAWRVSRLRWTISRTKCAKCCGPRTPGTPAWLPRQVLYRNGLSCTAFLHLCTAATAVELW